MLQFVHEGQVGKAILRRGQLLCVALFYVLDVLIHERGESGLVTQRIVGKGKHDGLLCRAGSILGLQVARIQLQRVQ